MIRSTMLRAVTAAALALALNYGAVMAQTSTTSNDNGTTTTRTEQRRGFDAGWLGLIGLFGLLGARRRSHVEDPYRRTETRGAHA